MSSANHVEIGYMHDLDHLELSAHPTRIWAPRKRVAHEHPIYLKGNVWRSKDCRNLKVVAKHSVRDGGDCAENHWQDSGSTLLSRVISFFLSQKKEKLSNNMWRESSVISLTERKMLLSGKIHEALRYVGVIWFIFHVLLLSIITLQQQNLCCISKILMKHLQKNYIHFVKVIGSALFVDL